MSTRRTSVYGSASGRIADPRDISSRKFMNESIHAIIDFLAEHNFNAAISPKLLSRPTTKQFQDIMTFLMRTIDPQYQFSGRFDNDVIQFLKGVGYPFGISKSSLTAVGSPHTWPALLACLAWLVELCEYLALTEEDDVVEEDETGERAFQAFVSRAYQGYVRYNDEEVEQLVQELNETLGKQAELVEEDVGRKRKELTALEQEADALGNSAERITELQHRIAALRKDRSTFQKLVKECAQHAATVQRKLEERQREVEAIETELRETESQRDAFRQQVENQEVSARDAERMAADRRRLEQGLREAESQGEAAQQGMWDAEKSLADALKAIEDKCREYNDRAVALHLLPESARNAKGRDFEIEARTTGLATDEVTERALVPRDIRGEVLPLLRELRSELKRSGHHARAQGLEHKDALEGVQEEASVARARVAEAEAEVERAEAALKREKEATTRAVAQKGEEAEAVEMQIQRLQEGATSEHLAGQHAMQLQQLEEEFAERRAEQQCLLQAQQEAVIASLDAFMDHKQGVQVRLRKLMSHIEEAQRRVAEARARVSELRSSAPTASDAVASDDVEVTLE